MWAAHLVTAAAQLAFAVSALGLGSCSSPEVEKVESLHSVGGGGAGTDTVEGTGSAMEGEQAQAGTGSGRPVDAATPTTNGSGGSTPLDGPDSGEPAPISSGDASLEPGGTSDAGALYTDASVDAGGGPYTEPLDPALAERLAALSERLAPLARRTADFWLEHGIDASFGGFHGTLNRQGAAVAPDDKGLIQEARHLWSFSTWYERREPNQRIFDIASQTYAFIVESFVDPVDGGFFFKVSRDGNRVVDAKKQLFAESYAIYALATYGRVFGVDSAIALALSRFRTIDAQRHDPEFGGYDERGDPGFLAAGAEKGTNTHLHLMEAFTALYEASGDSAVRERLDEVTRLIATTLCQPSGYVHKEFKRDWTPFGTPEVSYGHDLETAWLLMEAARVLRREGDAELRSAALRMAEHSSLRGFDGTRGGYFELGIVGGATTRFDKVWWVQFEALLGLWWAFELSGDAVQLDRLEATLGWIEQSEDLPVGEWFGITNPDLSAAGADYKGDEWKASYHSLRALLFTKDWVDAALSPTALSPAALSPTRP